MLDKEFDDSAWDTLVSAQWGVRSTAEFFDVPERRLLVAVLVDAVRLLVGSDVRERAGVIAWLRGGDARIPFRDLCCNLDLDPDQTARKLLRSEVLRRDARRTRTAPPARVANLLPRVRRRVCGPHEERRLLSA